ncbi:MAG: hypothetical protein IPN18_10925 [Ignavibacteriales bacterium]|nr:hypothetical protein [Ignavibacteriales bacterium]
MNQEWRDAYKERMKQEKNKKKLSHRKEVVEHVFGTIKLYMGAIPLLLRGIESCDRDRSVCTSVQF